MDELYCCLQGTCSSFALCFVLLTAYGRNILKGTFRMLNESNGTIVSVCSSRIGRTSGKMLEMHIKHISHRR